MNLRVARFTDEDGRAWGMGGHAVSVLRSVLFMCLLEYVAVSPGYADSAKRSAEFAPGVRLDWPRKRVEIQGRIVLRQGELELFACSPKTREHESIVVVQARPLHIFQALGLVGFSPGSPVRFDEKENRWLPPTGESLDLRVQYQDDGVRYTVPLESWLLDLKTKQSPAPLPWVFAASQVGADGRFAADDEGTVIAVVNFSSAIIAVGELHSADNAQLWIGAKTAMIPPIGTECIILVRAKAGQPREFRATLSSDGKVDTPKGPMTVADFVLLLRSETKPSEAAIFVLESAQGVSKEMLAHTLNTLESHGLDRKEIELRPLEKPSERSKSSDK